MRRRARGAGFSGGGETTEWFKIGKGVRQGYILTSYLFNLHTEYVMGNFIHRESRQGEAQVKVESEAAANGSIRVASRAGSSGWDSGPAHSDTWSV